MVKMMKMMKAMSRPFIIYSAFVIISPAVTFTGLTRYI